MFNDTQAGASASVSGPAGTDDVVAAPASVTYPSGAAFAVVVPGAAEAARYAVTESCPAAPLIQATEKAQLSQHFCAGDFAPNDPSYTYLRVHPMLVQKLEQLRQTIDGHFIHVMSGYRPPAYNRCHGGGEHSKHLNGLAANVSCPGVSLERFYVAAQKVLQHCGLVECYSRSGYLHIEVHPPGGAT